MASPKRCKTMALPRYYIPSGLERAIKDNEGSAEGMNVQNKFVQVLKKLKNIDCLKIAECHFLQFLKLGLYLEEYQQKIDTVKQFQIKGTTIEKEPNSEDKFKIKIENNDEIDQNINISDSLIAYQQHQRKPIFFLTVINVCKDHMIVTATKMFCRMYNPQTKYNVELKFNTYWFQCCHYALTVADPAMISRYIFPKKHLNISLDWNHPQFWFNEDVPNVPNQKQAVYNIVNKSSFPAPYILYGPPGTGKTSTLVEAICQSRKFSDKHILICAPSNAACDVITIRLLDYIPVNNLYRIYSRTEEYSRINEVISQCCNFKNNVYHEIEQVDLFSKQIIITTLCTSLRLEKLKLSFSHVFIDEAGQAMPADFFLPLSCALKFSRDFLIVISGDHQQLGPCVRSKLAEPLLGQSILEKLMKDDPYKRDPKTGYDPRYITKLIRNFRSSKEIIHVSNALFYNNELIACKKGMKLNFFPVVFHVITGMEKKASGSTSSYNEVEITEVLSLVNGCLAKRLGDKIIKAEDIGIVTPFKLQDSKIRNKLNDAGFEEVDVGTVEIFQGREKEIIIISTVRSKTFSHNGVQHIGFLSNPKRFNVALTRAKTLLVVMGDPAVLQTNKYWRYFLKYCQENNSVHGELPFIKDEISSLLPDSTISSRIKRSTDLFDNALTILRIDDGVLITSKSNVDDEVLNSSKSNGDDKALKNILESNYSKAMQFNASSRTTSTSNTTMSNVNSFRNTPASKNVVFARQNCSNSTPITTVITASMRKPMSDLNAVSKTTVLSSNTNSSIINLNSMPRSSVKTISTGVINSAPNPSLNTDRFKKINSARTPSLNTDRFNTINSARNPTRPNFSNIHDRKSAQRNDSGCFCCCIL